MGDYFMIDTSHGDGDIRQNYIIDKKYVLRLNSVAVMSEERLSELNKLIKRYCDYGIHAPYFIKNVEGKFLGQIRGMHVYLSEYLNEMVADDFIQEHPKKRAELIEERLILITKYAQKFKNKELIQTRSMYSIFDLAPYDEPAGIDEKQDNLNDLVKALRSMGENELANLFEKENESIRAELKKRYKSLPCCVFQGDENFSNICVDEDGHTSGLFDFNMSGTEVCANYLANIAFQGNFSYKENIFDEHSAKWVYDNVMDSFWSATQIIKEHYSFDDLELNAYYMYAKLVLMSGYVNVCAFMEYLQSDYESALMLLKLIVDTQLGERIGENSI